MRVLPLFLVPLLLGPAAAVADGAQDAVLLRALADEDAEGHEGALERWEALGAKRQVALLRETLQGEDVALATIAAQALGPEHLSASEIRRQMSILVRDPAWVVAMRRPAWAPGDWIGLGGPDLVPLFTHAVDDPEFEPDPEQWQHVHRVASPAHVPALVALLDRARGGIYGELIGLLHLLAAYDGADRYRPLLARAFLHAIQREQDEAAEREPTPLAEIEVRLTSDGKGLPPAFVRLVAEPGNASVHWLRRWAGELEPGPRDVELLMDLVDRKDSYFPFWALRHLARIQTPEARAFLEEVFEAGRWTGIFAAAALLEAGDRRHWEELLADEDERVHARRVAWVVDPAWAREAWLRDPTDRLEPMRRVMDRTYEGLGVCEEDVRWIAERMRSPERGAVERARFFTETHPEGLTRDLAREIAASLLDVSDEGLEELDLEPALGLLEVNAPEETRTLLSQRAPTLPWMADLLARLEEPGGDLERLRTQARSDDEVTALRAFFGLAVHGGVPVRLARLAFDSELHEGLGEEPWPAVRRLLLEGDAVGAVLLLYQDGDSVATHELGLLDDERARKRLRGIREERHLGLYWQATAGLAIAGDEEARREFLALLADDRTWMLDCLLDRSLALEGDPSLAPFWISRLDTNCCLQFHAVVALGTIFPTLPYEQAFGLPLEAPVATWFDRARRGGFASSRILGGLVPRAP